jgi:hypothetical protein
VVPTVCDTFVEGLLTVLPANGTVTVAPERLYRRCLAHQERTEPTGASSIALVPARKIHQLSRQGMATCLVHVHTADDA